MSSVALTVVTVPFIRTPLEMRRLELLGQLVVDTARELCPVETGFLQDSIDYYIEGNTLVVEASADYADFVEYGTVKQDPQPFLETAIALSEEEIMDTVIASEQDALRVTTDLIALNTIINIINK